MRLAGDMNRGIDKKKRHVLFLYSANKVVKKGRMIYSFAKFQISKLCTFLMINITKLACLRII